MKVTFWPNGNGEALVYSLLLSMLLDSNTPVCNVFLLIHPSLSAK